MCVCIDIYIYISLKKKNQESLWCLVYIGLLIWLCSYLWNKLVLRLWSLKKNHPLSGSMKAMFYAGETQKLSCSTTSAFALAVKSTGTFQVLNYTGLFGWVCRTSHPFSHIRETVLIKSNWSVSALTYPKQM